MMRLLPGRFPEEYGELGATEFIGGMTRPGDRLILSQKVQEVVEELAVPHLEAALGAKVGERVYVENVQQTVPVRPHERFIAGMMRPQILPQNLRNDPRYTRWADLVERIYPKNGFVQWLQAKGLQHMMPETLLFDAGTLPKELPFEEQWIKFSCEMKGAPSVRRVFRREGLDPVKEFLALVPDSPYQIQKGIPRGGDNLSEGWVLSPHLWIEDSGEVKVNAWARAQVVGVHHAGSHFGGERPGQYRFVAEEYIKPLCQKLHADGYRGPVNPDFLMTSNGEAWLIENNSRVGGSLGPALIQERLGCQNVPCAYRREIKVGVSNKEVFRRVQDLGGIVYLSGFLAYPNPEDRTAGVMFIDPECPSLLEKAKAALAG